MTIKPRTVDNLGVDVSKQYAQNLQQLDTAFLEASKRLSLPTQVSVVIPYAPSEVELLFGLEQRNNPWALFFAPSKLSSYQQALFSYQIVPSLGSFEKQQADIEKISLLDLAKERERKKKKKKASVWQEEEEGKEEERERQILKKFLEEVAFLNKELAFVNSRRSQYHKG
jgi:hypothetical protein